MYYVTLTAAKSDGKAEHSRIMIYETTPKNIELNRMEFRLVLTEHDGRFSAKASDIPSGTDTGTCF